MKAIYDTQTQLLYPWPRKDEGEVVGLANQLVAVTVTESEIPDFDEDTETAELVDSFDAGAKTVTRTWTKRDLTPTEVASLRAVKYPPAEAVDVRDWLLDQGITALMVEAQIVQLYPDPTEQAKTLNRWQHATRIPRDHPLVVSIGAALGFTPEQLDSEWNSILSR